MVNVVPCVVMVVVICSEDPEEYEASATSTPANSSSASPATRSTRDLTPSPSCAVHVAPLPAALPQHGHHAACPCTPRSPCALPLVLNCDARARSLSLRLLQRSALQQRAALPELQRQASHLRRSSTIHVTTAGMQPITTASAVKISGSSTPSRF